MLRFNAVHGEQSIFSGVRRLEPGTLRQFSLASMAPGDGGSPKRFWSPAEAAAAMMEARSERPATVAELEDVLRDACKLRSLADVPVGAFLSGGIDSSLVVALMQAESTHPVRTFSIGFSERKYNEAHYAKQVAEHLGTDHTELYVTPEQAREVIPRLPEIYDEPFSDKSQLPTVLVCELARRDVTVALSGDGGDELFLGYDRYLFARKWWQRLRPLRPARRLSGAVHGPLRALGNSRLAEGTSAQRAAVVAGLLAAPSFEHFYRFLFSHYKDVQELVHGQSRSSASFGAQATRALPVGSGVIERAASEDAAGYLVEDILVKVDRASMSTSLEVRAPLLDYRVFELAWRFSEAQRVRGEQGKFPLRELLWKHVPRQLVERPKMGFGVPVGEWMCGPLRSWADDLLSENALKWSGMLNQRVIQHKWIQHRNKSRSYAPELWAVLMFQAWWDRWMR